MKLRTLAAGLVLACLVAPVLAQQGGSPPAAGRGAAGRGAVAGPQPAPAPGLLNAMFQDHAVLQRGQPIKVYGNAPAATSVSVSLNGATASAAADASGHWIATLPAMAPGGPFTLTATGGGKTETATDVLVGDVFLCSGQSNMALAQSAAANAAADARTANDGEIRQLNVDTTGSTTPLANFATRVAWIVEAPDTVPRFSAACWYFARELKKTTKAPIGLVLSAWPGARIRDWVSEAALRRIGDFNDDLDILDTYRTDPQAAMRAWGRKWEAWWRSLKLGGAPPWEANFDDSAWPTVPNTGTAWALWKGNTNPDGFIGQMWMRTTVTLSAAQAAAAQTAPANLDLGSVNEEDETWINGKDVGGTSFSNKAEHVVPAGVLKEGVNVIVSNIFCSWRNCGFRGPDANRVLRLADGGAVVLSNPWRYRQMSDKDDIIAPQIPWGITHGLTMDYNGMLAPIGPYGFKAAVWYQGESDVYFAPHYRATLDAMMADWRRQLENPTLPFLIVQIPNYGNIPDAPAASGWADVREAQRLSVKDDKHAALTVNVDIGDAAVLHPTNKQEVGRRLAIAARHLVYGEPIAPSGPEVSGATRDGGTVAIAFSGVTGRLVGHSGINGFELCGKTLASCRWANARITGNSVILPNQAGATRVRYCWGDAPVCTLYDTSGLPAGPFETAIRAK